MKLASSGKKCWRKQTVLAEKRMPGFKATQDRLILMLDGNASRDCKLKPLKSTKLKIYML